MWWLLVLVWIFSIFVYYKCFVAPPKFKNDISAKNKWVIVTGGASGIGKATALELLNRGAKVIVFDINFETLQEIYKQHIDANTCQVFKVDVSSKQSVDDAFFKVEEFLTADKSQLFGLVNNAGVATNIRCGLAEMGDFDAQENELNRMFGVNILGLIRCTTHAYKLLTSKSAAANSDTASPCIVNIASTSGRIEFPFAGYYSATKFAVEGYSGSLRRELELLKGTSGHVRVSVIEPGMTETNIIKLPPMPPTTRFEKMFKKFEPIFETRPKFQGPEIVAQVIADCMFSSNNPANVKVESAGFAVAWIVAPLMYYGPSSITDAIITAMYGAK